jgi:hypothetical protein
MDTLATALVVVLLVAAMGGHIAVLIAFKYRGDAFKALRAQPREVPTPHAPMLHAPLHPGAEPATAAVASHMSGVR